MNLAWLMRAKRWAKNPPSKGRVKFVLAIVAVCIVLFVYDRIFGWPDWLTPDRMGRMPR